LETAKIKKWFFSRPNVEDSMAKSLRRESINYK
jgi:hypothetical protein